MFWITDFERVGGWVGMIEIYLVSLLKGVVEDLGEGFTYAYKHGVECSTYLALRMYAYICLSVCQHNIAVSALVSVNIYFSK